MKITWGIADIKSVYGTEKAPQKASSKPFTVSTQNENTTTASTSNKNRVSVKIDSTDPEWYKKVNEGSAQNTANSANTAQTTDASNKNSIKVDSTDPEWYKKANGESAKDAAKIELSESDKEILKDIKEFANKHSLFDFYI